MTTTTPVDVQLGVLEELRANVLDTTLAGLTRATRARDNAAVRKAAADAELAAAIRAALTAGATASAVAARTQLSKSRVLQIRDGRR